MILDLQRSLRRLGKIRMGDQQATSNGKKRPAKLTNWRITSPNLDLLSTAAAIYGGEPRRWEGAPDGEQFELYTTTDTLDIIVPPGPTVLDQHYELWSAGGCQRRCDGVTDNLNSQPCQCPSDHEERDALSKNGQACKITSRLSVILPRVPDIGTWMLESHGYYAAVELAGSMEILAMASRAGQLVPAHLRIQPRTVKRKGQTLRFIVPIIELPTLSAATLMTGETAGALPAPAALEIAPPPAAIGSGEGEGPAPSAPARTLPELPGDEKPAKPNAYAAAVHIAAAKAGIPDSLLASLIEEVTGDPSANSVTRDTRQAVMDLIAETAARQESGAA